MMVPILVEARNVAVIAGGRRPLPVGADQQIEAGLGAVHGAEIGKAVGPDVGRLKDPEALAEVGHLNDHRLAAKIENAEAIDEILARAGDVALPRADIVVQHGEVIDRRDRRDAADEEGLGRDTSA